MHLNDKACQMNDSCHERMMEVFVFMILKILSVHVGMLFWVLVIMASTFR